MFKVTPFAGGVRPSDLAGNNNLSKVDLIAASFDQLRRGNRKMNDVSWGVSQTISSENAL
jgi:hypothetical protein